MIKIYYLTHLLINLNKKKLKTIFNIIIVEGFLYLFILNVMYLN